MRLVNTLKNLVVKVKDFAIRITSLEDKLVFSTSEKRIGTWNDGKPLYRITFTFTAPSGTATTDVVTFDTIKFDYIKLVEVNIYSANNSTQFNGNSFYAWIRKKGANPHSSIALQITNAAYCNYPADATIEYTKTTD